MQPSCSAWRSGIDRYSAEEICSKPIGESFSWEIPQHSSTLSLVQLLGKLVSLQQIKGRTMWPDVEEVHNMVFNNNTNARNASMRSVDPRTPCFQIFSHQSYIIVLFRSFGQSEDAFPSPESLLVQYLEHSQQAPCLPMFWNPCEISTRLPLQQAYRREMGGREQQPDPIQLVHRSLFWHFSRLWELFQNIERSNEL